MSRPKIVHCKRENYDIYIGRKNGDLPQSKWANPLVIGKDGTREEVIARYESWIKTQPDLMSALPELKGKTLGCWCKGTDGANDVPCHGDVLVKMAGELESKTTIIPLFTSEYSYGESILTFEEVGKTKPGYPYSICDIVKENSLKQVVVVDTRPDGYIQSYKNIQASGLAHLIYGIKLCVCDDMSVKTDDSLRNEHNVIIFFNNTQGYYDYLKIGNRAWGPEGFYYRGRADFKLLKQFWTPNLTLALPFFSSFLARNTLSMATIVPDFPVPANEILVFNEIESGLPFASLIENSVVEFSSKFGASIQPAKSIYYKDSSSFESYMTNVAIHEGGTFSNPGKRHFASNRFSFEAWKEASK